MSQSTVECSFSTGSSEDVVDLDALAGEDGDLAVLHDRTTSRVYLMTAVTSLAMHVESVAVAQHQRTVLPGSDELFGMLGADDAQAVGTFDPVEHLAERRPGCRP